MSIPIFLLLGGNKLNYGIMKKFQKKGYKVVVVDWNKFPEIIGDVHFQIDVKDDKKIIEALKKNDMWANVAFAYSSMDAAVKSVASINRKIGMNTISDKGIEYATSKSKMTEKWREDNLLNRLSKMYIDYEKEIYNLNCVYDIIIKPDNAASSRGITILSRGSEERNIKKAFEYAKSEATNNLVIVEEFIKGIEYTVEMIGDNYGNVCVYAISKKEHTLNAANNKIAVKLHYNVEQMDLQKKIANYAIKAYKSLGLSSSLGHLEVILKEDGIISPIEIGARSSGFIASDLVDIVSGKDFLLEVLEVQKGGKVQEGLCTQTNMSSVYFFYDLPQNSLIKEVCSIMDFCNCRIKSRYSDLSNIKKGKRINKLSNDNERIGFEILEGPKEILTAEYLKEKEKEMLKKMVGR